MYIMYIIYIYYIHIYIYIVFLPASPPLVHMFHMPCRPPQMPTEIDGFPPFRRLATVLGLFGPILYHIYIYIHINILHNISSY